jgi:GNAT superfamily N-acetyltransferase
VDHLFLPIRGPFSLSGKPRRCPEVENWKRQNFLRLISLITSFRVKYGEYTSCRENKELARILNSGKLEDLSVAFFLRDETVVLGGLLGDIWPALLHVRTLALAAPVRGRGFDRELMKRAELYAFERGCTEALLDIFNFQARPFFERLGYRVFGTLENHLVGHQHYFMTKKLNSGE